MYYMRGIERCCCSDRSPIGSFNWKHACTSEVFWWCFDFCFSETATPTHRVLTIKYLQYHKQGGPTWAPQRSLLPNPPVYHPLEMKWTLASLAISICQDAVFRVLPGKVVGKGYYEQTNCVKIDPAIRYCSSQMTYNIRGWLIHPM